jgi:hypothetical protein
MIDTAACIIKGLALVFHDSENIVRQLDGMVNTFIIVSVAHGNRRNEYPFHTEVLF